MNMHVHGRATQAVETSQIYAVLQSCNLIRRQDLRPWRETIKTNDDTQLVLGVRGSRVIGAKKNASLDYFFLS